MPDPVIAELAQYLRKQRQRLPKQTSEDAYAQQARALAGVTKGARESAETQGH